MQLHGVRKHVVDILRKVIGAFLSTTDTNALLGTGAMYLLSGEQLAHLLGNNDMPLIEGQILDIGAGCGSITDRYLAFLGREYLPNGSSTKVFATEVSRSMVRVLRRKPGYEVFLTSSIAEHRCPSVWGDAAKLGLISCLNVLDRCLQPWTLLNDIRRLSLKHSCCPVLIGIVLPFSQFLEAHVKHGSQISCWRRQHSKAVAERMTYPGVGLHSLSFEEHAGNFARFVLKKAGLRVAKFARVPYISAGDAVSPLYVLTNAIYVVHPMTDEELQAMASVRVGNKRCRESAPCQTDPRQQTDHHVHSAPCESLAPTLRN